MSPHICETLTETERAMVLTIEHTAHHLIALLVTWEDRGSFPGEMAQILREPLRVLAAVFAEERHEH